jgi:hypothetical protein
MEKDMFPIIKEELISQGYDVKAEIMNADVVAIRDDLVIVVEMKSVFSTKLIYQGLKRLHLSDYVYLAIEKPSEKVLKSSSFHEKKTIVRRLELGLILVDLHHRGLNIILDPKTYHFKKDKKKRRRLLKEFNLRQTSLNTGGVTRTKVITAYRELALLALDAMRHGPQSTKFLREYTNRKKVVSVLQKNYYGWFERVSRGVYQLSHLGEEALIQYKDVIDELNKKEFK